MNVREKHSTFNIQHSTSDFQQTAAITPLDVQSWLLNVECCGKEGGG